MCEVKRCTKCREEKPLSAFGRHSKMKDGLRSDCKACIRLYTAVAAEAKRAYKQQHAAQIKAQNLAWRKANPDYWVIRRALAPERFLTKKREWEKNNKGRLLAYVAERRAARVCRTPKCLAPSDLKAIRDCYSVAASFRELFDLDVHVDHVVPLRGVSVSGLHVPWNLRIVPAGTNKRKSNNWSEAEAFATSTAYEICI